ncbi:hypothetical protein ZIOFF_047580 [Zingiber officinale]|uniref:CCHC-type domain-containing protein n=1 Tax=Zingiber officinale TaxID=94328 RepID=A0A8J5FTG0_ZINOF|nr:hypothetical protein ZIOFF_047580 [Zingiber officinale]
MLVTCWIGLYTDMPPRRYDNRTPEIREERCGEAPPSSPPSPPPQSLSSHEQMLAGMNQFFALFTGHDVELGHKAKPEAVYERFRKMGPKDFSGTIDPMVDALLWWEGTSLSVDPNTLSWEGFKEVFYSKYFTEDIHSKLTREFMTLRQDDRSVAKFVREFDRGCHFVPLIDNNPKEKLRHFIDGLRPILRRDVRVADPKEFIEAVTRALRAEQDQRDSEVDRQGKGPYLVPHQQPQQHNKGKFIEPSEVKVLQPQMRVAPNPNDYPCGATGHMIRDCPQNKQPIPGRVFMMQAGEADPDTTLIIGRIIIAGEATKALLDSGATHSFISDIFVSYLDIKPARLDVSYSVIIPSGEELLTTCVVRDLGLELQGHTVQANLIVLPMPESNIILGMDWLMANRVIIDFQRRSVLIRPIGMEQFAFEPGRCQQFLRMISCMQARKLLLIGCQAFLVSIIATPVVGSPSLEEVEVVTEFPNIFPDDIIGIPPEQEVEYGGGMSSAKAALESDTKVLAFELHLLATKHQFNRHILPTALYSYVPFSVYAMFYIDLSIGI